MTEESEQKEQQKIVVNRGFGGFSVKESVVEWMREQGCSAAEDIVITGEEYDDGSVRGERFNLGPTYPRDLPRDDPHLIAAVEANKTSDLSITEVPADTEWVITKYDGAETVREKHRTFPGGEFEEGIANSWSGDSP